MKFYIRYMIGLRGKIVVKEELRRLGLHYGVIDQGAVEVLEDIDADQYRQLSENLLKSGMQVLDEETSHLIEKIINVVIQMVHYEDELPESGYEEYISRKLDCDYEHLAEVFQEVKSISISQFINGHRVERVKEYLLYDERSLKDIAARLKYSSIASMSHQFKNVTGLTPTAYKKLKEKRRRILMKA